MKTKIHTQYKLANGRRIPGVTTILDILAKPALIHWAWELGTIGVDYKKYRDDKAEIGTLAHYLIMCHLQHQDPDTSDYSGNQIDKAENALLSFYEWEKSHPLEPILIEQPLVSEQLKYGGTLDLLARINGKVCLVDFKTGKGIYDDMVYQLGAYWYLLQENNYMPDSARILRIGRDESEGFEERMVGQPIIQRGFMIFERCLTIYNLQKEIKKIERS